MGGKIKSSPPLFINGLLYVNHLRKPVMRTIIMCLGRKKYKGKKEKERSRSKRGEGERERGSYLHHR